MDVNGREGKSLLSKDLDRIKYTLIWCILCTDDKSCRQSSIPVILVYKEHSCVFKVVCYCTKQVADRRGSKEQETPKEIPASLYLNSVVVMTFTRQLPLFALFPSLCGKQSSGLQLLMSNYCVSEQECCPSLYNW